MTFAFWLKNLQTYICPANLQEEHDRYVRKLQTIQEKAKIAEDIHKAQEREASFKEHKENFFGIRINDGEIEVKVLESVEGYRQEAECQHICLFGAAYDQREDSLIFSARIDGRIIETIEVDLKTLKVVQSRGVCNQNTEYHDRIVNLINANTHLIKERITA